MQKNCRFYTFLTTTISKDLYDHSIPLGSFQERILGMNLKWQWVEYWEESRNSAILQRSQSWQWFAWDDDDDDDGDGGDDGDDGDDGDGDGDDDGGALMISS